MARKLSTDYPEQFGQLFNKALAEEFSITMDEENIAINFVHQLNAYRRALRLEAHPLGPKFQAVAVKRKGQTIIMQNQGAIIESAIAHLNLKPLEPTEDELDAYIARLGESDEPSTDT